MSFFKISALAGFIALASKVSAHGTVTGIIADGVYYVGYFANYQYRQTQPVVVGWSTPQNLDNGFISDYTNPDIICHRGATNAKTSATVKAGGTVELQWTVWPESHHGPVIDYLASCGGNCTTVDKTKLEFFKIDGEGLIDNTNIPGKWAADKLIANNNSWTVTIPSTIAPGSYVLRHEIIALHSAGTVGGAQNYPQCFNLEVTGSGTDTPTGTLGTALYTPNDPGLLINIYAAIASYIVPGPALYSGAGSAPQPSVPATAVKSYDSNPTKTSSDSSNPGSGSGSGTGSGTPSATPSTTKSSRSTKAPEGTTLGDLLSWMSSFYTKYAGKTYTEATVARRHARHVPARDMDSSINTGEFWKRAGPRSGSAYPSRFAQKHRP